MGERIADCELRRRAIDGLLAEVEAFGSGAEGSRLIRRDGLLASLVPIAPQRSIFNSVLYEDREALAGALDDLGRAYEEAGVRAWTVWVPDEDREAAQLLGSRGHLLDSAPRAMALELDDLSEAPPAPPGVQTGEGTTGVCAELNDLAYGYGPDGFRSALAGETSIRWHLARRDGEPICCVGTIEVGDDCCVTGVATPPEHRGRGLAGWLLHTALAEARERGLRTASLQASRAGAPLYERLGFRDFGHVEMWELRG